MSDSELRKSLHALVTDTIEYLSYLRELGVDGVENPENSQARVKASVKAVDDSKPALSYSVLERNALASSTQSVPNGRPRLTADSTPELTAKPASTNTPIGEPMIARANETLDDVWNDTRGCTRCPLCEGRTNVVNSEGNRRAQLMFVGEAPGADEDVQARPFVGRAGQLLNKVIESIGLKREDVFIGNVNRCRPPQNRTPTPAEGITCKPFIIREIDIVKPKVIVVLGNVAMKNLLDTKQGITKLRGKFLDYKGIKVMPTFHPAYLLRDPSKKRETWEDMKMVRDYLNSIRPEIHKAALP